MTWQEEQRQKRLHMEARGAQRPADNVKAKEMCPLCALDIRRIPASYADLYHKFHIYSCATWSDVYHTAAANIGSQVGGCVLIRLKVEK